MCANVFKNKSIKTTCTVVLWLHLIILNYIKTLRNSEFSTAYHFAYMYCYWNLRQLLISVFTSSSFASTHGLAFKKTKTNVGIFREKALTGISLSQTGCCAFSGQCLATRWIGEERPVSNDNLSVGSRPIHLHLTTASIPGMESKQINSCSVMMEHILSLQEQATRFLSLLFCMHANVKLHQMLT